MDKEYINSWIEIAIKDLEVSKILFDKKSYSNSFYHFQQASEKALKAYAFMTKIFRTEKDAFQTSHYTLKVFKESAIEQQNKIEEFKQYNTNSLIDEKDLNKYSSDLNSSINLIPEKKEVFEYPTKMLDEILNLTKELREYSIEIPSDFDKLLRTKMDAIIEFVKTINPDEAEKMKIEFDIIFESKQNLEELSNFIKDYNNLIVEESLIVLVLFYSNLISHNHNNLCRYPEKEFNPLKYYTLKKPIIKKLSEFTENLHFVLQKMKKINSLTHVS